MTNDTFPVEPECVASVASCRDPRLAGLCDLHVHTNPDVKSRAHDDLSMARACRDAGFRALVIKSHDWSTHDRAYLVRQSVPGFECLGSVTLNLTHGPRVNPLVVERALQTTGNLCRIVWMPTYQSAWDARHRFPGQQGLAVTDGRGRVLPEVVRVMEMCAHADIVFATGHSAPEDVVALVRRAKKAGVKKCVVTHATSHIWRLSPDQIKACAESGAYIEHCAIAVLWGPGTAMPQFTPTSMDALAEAILLAPERSFLSSDMGSAGMPSPPEAMRLIMDGLLARGVSAVNLDRMTKTLPAWLAGLDAY